MGQVQTHWRLGDLNEEPFLGILGNFRASFFPGGPALLGSSGAEEREKPKLEAGGGEAGGGGREEGDQ